MATQAMVIDYEVKFGFWILLGILILMLKSKICRLNIALIQHDINDISVFNLIYLLKE